ncbi:MAG: gamma-glutamyltransferase [Kiloniellales bacterium]|nr:gamma-glutamyltransferase [Kiloniellales bacterium]
MLNTPRAYGGMVTAPHHLAAEAGLGILSEGGNAVEAMLAAAATVAVVYPHMNSLGGDGFWLISAPGAAPRAIDAAGHAGAAVTPDFYRDRGLAEIPARGPLAVNTVPGAVAGWAAALAQAAALGGRLPLSRLLAPAIHYAEAGAPVTRSLFDTTTAKRGELAPLPGFAETFLPGGAAPAVGSRFRQPALAASLRRLAEAGLDDFYRGALARALAADLAAAGSPLTAADLEAGAAEEVEPLTLDLKLAGRPEAGGARVYNLPPPTQGLASLIILGLFDRLAVAEAEGFDHIHGLVEATKQAFLVRDREVADPGAMAAPAQDFLAAARLDALAAAIDRRRALAWPQPAPGPGDTVWLAAADAEGRVVSYIQSIFWEFGSGVVSAETGILLQNRGSSFALDPALPRAAVPGRKPFHTLNPALAVFGDGRVLAYGCMGGEGQPQTQAAVFSRYAGFGQELQTAVTAPRWLLGRAWGAESTTLKLERRFAPALIDALEAAGHDVEPVAEITDLMGHAGAVVRHDDGLLEGASDPRSDGAVAAL